MQLYKKVSLNFNLNNYNDNVLFNIIRKLGIHSKFYFIDKICKNSHEYDKWNLSDAIFDIPVNKYNRCRIHWSFNLLIENEATAYNTIMEQGNNKDRINFLLNLVKFDFPDVVDNEFFNSLINDEEVDTGAEIAEHYLEDFI